MDRTTPKNTSSFTSNRYSLPSYYFQVTFYITNPSPTYEFGDMEAYFLNNKKTVYELHLETPASAFDVLYRRDSVVISPSTDFTMIR